MMKKLMLKRMGTGLILMIFLFTAVLSIMGMKLEAYAVDFSPPDIMPNIVATVEDNVLYAGKTAKVIITLKNISTQSIAKEILFNPVYSSENTSFASIKPLTETPIKRIEKNASTEFEVLVETDTFAKEGLQPLSFELTYKNVLSEEESKEYTVYLKVINYQTNCKLVLSTMGSISASAGGTFELPLRLKNNGNLSAKDAKITVKDLSQDTFTVVSGTGRIDFDRLYGNETRDLNYTLRASPSLKGGSHPIAFSLIYSDEKGTVIEE
ncbi:MAG: hypothetical protein GX796_01110, partial [Clostridiaceae bacterium]|nr:hypothetical protein [Clostridiaceae bacterium]